MASTYKVKVDKSKCIGCGTCSALAPKTFKMNDADQKAEPLPGEHDDDKTVLQAAQSCPVFAIIVEKDGKQVFPKE